MCRDLRREEEEDAVHAPETLYLPICDPLWSTPQEKPCVVPEVRLYLVLQLYL